MNDPDERIEEPVYHIEDLVKGLKIAFPNANYIAINASLTTANSKSWVKEWYVAGFEEAPYMRELEGYYTWVKTPDINNPGDEDAIFFTHFNSDFWYYKDQPLQISRYEFMDEKDLCFYVADSGEVLQFNDEDHLLWVKEENVDPNTFVDKIINQMKE